MEIDILNPKSNLTGNNRLQRKYDFFEKLIEELRSRELSHETKAVINQEVELVNAIYGSDREFRKQLRKSQTLILRLIEKEHGLVTKNYYRNQWVALGMSIFGVPIGVAMGAALGDMSFLSIGFPIGMAIGIAIGTQKDTKARQDGKQLVLESSF